MTEIPQTPFTSVILDCIKEYVRHYPQKKDSWKTLEMEHLQRLLERAYLQLVKRWDYGQAIDVINLAMMIAKRLEGFQK